MRRPILALAAIAVLAMACQGGPASSGSGDGAANGATSACADYPSKPIRFIVHTSPGGGSDVFARMIADVIQTNQLSSQPFVVENIEGGSGANAIRALAEGDEYTILATPISIIVNTLRGGVGVDLGDLTPISRLQLDPNVWLVRDDAPWSDAQELLDEAIANPGDITVGFGSIGSSDHMLFFQVAQATGAEFSYVNHDSGGDAMVNMLGGHIDMASGQPSEALEQIKAGEARALLVLSSDERLPMLPDVPTAAELGIEVAGETPRGILGAPDMCPEAVAYLEDIFRQVTETDEWEEYVEKNGVVSSYLNSAEYGAYIDDQSERLEALIDEMDLRQE